MNFYRFIDKIGHYSGNRRLDCINLEEPDADTEKVRERWLKANREILIKRRLRMWKTYCPEFENLIIHQVGESHIDCAWMWRYEQTRKKAQVTFRKAVLHAKMFPETFCFALSQPLLLEWIKQDDPKLFKQIQATVKAGNIELVGGSYVEPDCMMPSGESFVRQRLYGMRFLRNNFGNLPNVEWFLDSFGYNFGLPQILIKSGAKYFWTTKITWNRITTFPFVNFWWEGPDGTRILMANFEMNMDSIINWAKYNVGRYLLKRDSNKVWNYSMDYSKLKEHVGEEFCPHVGCFFGKGDGGHGPTHKEVAYANEQAKLSIFKWSRVKTFYEEIEKYSERFPVWNDELYLEYHRGCFSNHSEVKRHNRMYENIIVSLEILALLTSFLNSEYRYPVNTFETLWKITLKNQFHDVLPGSSIPEVFDDCWDDWKDQDQMIENIMSNIGIALTSQKSVEREDNSTKIILFNQVTWERNSRVFIPLNVFEKTPKLDKKGKPNYAAIKILIGEDNTQYYCQPVAADLDNEVDPFPAGWWTVIPLKPLSYTPVILTLLNDQESVEMSKKSSFNVSNDIISSESITVKLDPTKGAILELTSPNVNNGKNLLIGGSSNLTQGFLDAGTPQDPDQHAWNLTPEYWKFPLDLSNDRDVNIEITELGPIFTTLKITRTLGISSVIQKITLFLNCPEIFMEYLTNWKQKDVMLKLIYNTSTIAEIVTADAAYCAIESKTKPETPCDKARYEKICHKYFDLSTPDRKWGLSILNEGKYAFDVNGGIMKLTLLRVCKYPIPAVEAWVNIERDENERKFQHKVPKYSGLGPFSCRYALLPHKGGALRDSKGSPNVVVKRKAEEFNKPVLVIPSNNFKIVQENLEKLGSPLIQINTPNIFLEALKIKEWDETGTIIIRLVESSGVSSRAKITFSSVFSEKLQAINSTDLLERKIHPRYNWDKDNGVLSFDIGKFEILTFELVL